MNLDICILIENPKHGVSNTAVKALAMEAAFGSSSTYKAPVNAVKLLYPALENNTNISFDSSTLPKTSPPVLRAAPICRLDQRQAETRRSFPKDCKQSCAYTCWCNTLTMCIRGCTDLEAS
jgi:hypothetical protein